MGQRPETPTLGGYALKSVYRVPRQRLRVIVLETQAVWRQTVLLIGRESIKHSWLECLIG